MELCTTDIHAVYEARSAFLWPVHSGSLLRGLLGRALRGHGCARAAGKAPGLAADAVHRPCEGACEAPGACTYARLFDPPARDPAPHRFLEKSERPPAPMVLVIPRPGARGLEVGARVDVGVRLLGERSGEEIGAVCAAMESMAEMPVGTDGGRWALGEIRQVGARNRRVEIAAAGTVKKLRIEFETPAWVETGGRLLPSLQPQTLFRAVARRISVVCALYGALGPDHDAVFAELDALAAGARVTRRKLRVMGWERLSLERGARHPMRGLVGAIEVEGELGPLVPWLGWGEIVHVGKSTIYGLGRMRVTVP